VPILLFRAATRSSYFAPGSKNPGSFSFSRPPHPENFATRIGNEALGTRGSSARSGWVPARPSRPRLGHQKTPLFRSSSTSCSRPLAVLFGYFLPLLMLLESVRVSRILQPIVLAHPNIHDGLLRRNPGVLRAHQWHRPKSATRFRTRASARRE
jgi:hypothetical protein